MKEILNYLIEGNFLEKEKAKSILLEIGQGKHNPYQIASFLTVFSTRKIQPDEFAGFQEAMQELSLKLDLTEYDAIDIVGTGGDNKNSFNISTATSMVVAASGVNVTKHGNYGVSSICGSSSLLEFLGVKFSNESAHLKKMLDECNFCMLHAPLFHPAMKFLAPIRKELQIKTFFNMLGPLINPSFPKKQFLGVNNLFTAKLYSQIYKESNIRYIIVHSLDGYDEISLTNDTWVNFCGKEKQYLAKDFGFTTIQPSAIVGGKSIAESAKIFQAILKDEGSLEQKNVVLANSAMAISLAKNIDYQNALFLAKETLESKKAFHTLKKLTSL